MLKLLASEWFTPKSKPSARYRIRALTGLEFMEVEDIIDRDLGTDGLLSVRRGKGRLPKAAIETMLRAGVTDWDDVVDEVGEPVPFEPDRVKQIPWAHMNELAAAISERSVLSGEQEKNSSSRSKSRRKGKTSTA